MRGIPAGYSTTLPWYPGGYGGYTPPCTSLGTPLSSPSSSTQHPLRDSSDELTALRRKVAERTVSDGRVTVHSPVSLLGVIDTRFTVGRCCSHPGLFPMVGVPSAQRALLRPSGRCESGEERAGLSARFEQKVLNQAGIRGGPARG